MKIPLSILRKDLDSCFLLPLEKFPTFEKYFQIEIGGAASKSYVEPDMACISGKECIELFGQPNQARRLPIKN